MGATGTTGESTADAGRDRRGWGTSVARASLLAAGMLWTAAAGLRAQETDPPADPPAQEAPADAGTERAADEGPAGILALENRRIGVSALPGVWITADGEGESGAAPWALFPRGDELSFRSALFRDLAPVPRLAAPEAVYGTPFRFRDGRFRVGPVPDSSAAGEDRLDGSPLHFLGGTIPLTRIPEDPEE